MNADTNISEKPDMARAKRILPLLLAFFFSLTAYYLCNDHTFNYYNNYSYLAQAWLDGHLYVDGMPEYLESVEFMGHQYMHFAPGASILCLPFVAVFGVDGFNCIYLSMFLGAANTLLAISVLRRAGIGQKESDRYWLGGMLTLGTVHFFCAATGSSWFLGHVSTLFYLLLAFYFLTKPVSSPGKSCLFLFLSGLFFGLAVTCRLTALLGAFFFIGYICLYGAKERTLCLKLLLSFACGAAVFGSLYMAYNFARFGTVMDQGYSLTYLKDYHREVYDMLQASPFGDHKRLLKEYTAQCGGPLQLRFVPYNLYSIFFMAPQYSPDPPHLVPSMAGVSLTFTSPMLYFAFLSDTKKKTTWLLWLSVLLTAIPFLLNYGNGMAQFGMRYSLDFTPYLWLLMCRGLTKEGSLKPWMKAGILLCFVIELWGTRYWMTYYS